MKISRANLSSGKSRFGVKWNTDKGIKNQFFETEDEREKFLAEMKLKAKKEGRAVLNFSTATAVLLNEALSLLGGDARTVVRAAEHYKERLALKSVPLAEAVQQFMDDKYNLGRDDNWMRANRKILHRFRDYMGDSAVCDCTTEQAQAWIFSIHFAPVTLKNHTKACGSFFNWCIDRKFCRENIFEKVRTPTVVQPEPEFLTVDQTRKMFQIARQHYPDALAYLSMQAFAGIRSSACSRIAPEQINFDARSILITAQNAKNNKRQRVENHPDNLWSWLNFARGLAPEGFSLSERMHRRRLTQIAEKAGFCPPHNAFRHSFCTYHVALFGDAGRTATLLTHRSNPHLLYKHYKGNASRTEAEKYFAILPENILEPGKQIL